MPVDVLWVEGYLDLEILGWILDLPGLTLRRGGSKHELGKLPAVATELGFAGGAGDVLPKLKSRLAKNPKILAELPEMQALKAQLRQTP